MSTCSCHLLHQPCTTWRCTTSDAETRSYDRRHSGIDSTGGVCRVLEAKMNASRDSLSRALVPQPEFSISFGHHTVSPRISCARLSMSYYSPCNTTTRTRKALNAPQTVCPPGRRRLADVCHAVHRFRRRPRSAIPVPISARCLIPPAPPP